MIPEVSAYGGALRRGPGPGWFLTACAVFLVLVALSESWNVLLPLASMALVAAILLRTQLANVVTGFKSSRFFLLTALVFHLLFRVWLMYGGGELGWEEHVQSTAFFMLRLVLFILVTTILLSQYSPTDYAEAAAGGLGKLLGWDFARHIGLIVALSLSLLPALKLHFEDRKLARRLRGVDQSNTLAFRLSLARQEFIAAMRYALDYSRTSAIVLWSRGYLERELRDEPAITKAVPTTVLSIIVLGSVCLNIQ
ncbi:MAG: hypothetical protein H6508_04500 [Calditrichaeota bacterium]|nr:hypothetical protein [Calditrichota bacterium]MCB9366428.1 hypothetical protein [Calditrichota bacterium]